MLGLADCLEIKHSFCQFLFIVQKPVTKCEINKKNIKNDFNTSIFSDHSAQVG